MDIYPIVLLALHGAHGKHTSRLHACVGLAHTLNKCYIRKQCSEAGVHAPTMAGIHGAADLGLFSVVLNGGYEDDEDNGDTVYVFLCYFCDQTTLFL